MASEALKAMFDGDSIVAPFGIYPGGAIERIVVSPNGADLLIAGGTRSAGTGTLFTTQGEFLSEFGNQLSPVFTANYSPDGSRIVTSSYDGSISQWSSTGELLSKQRAAKAALCDAEYLRNGRLLTASDNGSTTLRSASGRLIADHVSEGTAREVEISPNGRLMASSTDRGFINIFKTDGTLLRNFQAARGSRINSLEFSDDGKDILIGTYLGDARVFSLKGRQKLSVEATPSGIVNQAIYEPGTKRFATAGSDGFVRFWESDGTSLGSLAMPGSEAGAGVQSIAFSIDGADLFTAMTDKTLWTIS